jgi:hypothetical protein
VEGAGNFPEFGVGRVEAMKFLGVHRKDISVRATVDEKQRHRGMGNGVGRIGLREIYVIVQACVEQAGFDHGATKSFTEPKSEVRELGELAVSAIAKGSEGRFGDCTAEAWFGGQRLYEDRGPHGFSKTINTMRSVLVIEPGDPAVDVVALENAVGSEGAATFAVRARVGKEDGVSVGKEETRVAADAFAVIGDPVKEHDGAAIGVFRSDEPCAEDGPVGSGDADGLQVGMKFRGDDAARELRVPDRAVRDVQGDLERPMPPTIETRI